MGLTEDINTVKTLARQFSALANVEAAADRIASAVAHEAELKAAVAALLKEKSDLAAQVDVAKSEVGKKMAAAQSEHDAWERQYTERRESIRAAVLSEENDAKARIAAAKGAVKQAEADRDVQLKDIAAEVQAAVADAQDQTDVAVAVEKAKQNDIAAQTAEMQKHLDDLKSKITPLLA